MKENEKWPDLYPILGEVLEGSVLGTVLYPLYNSLPEMPKIFNAIFANDTEILTNQGYLKQTGRTDKHVNLTEELEDPD